MLGDQASAPSRIGIGLLSKTRPPASSSAADTWCSLLSRIGHSELFPLAIEHGAPLRLRLETQYGFTMVKYIRAIEFVETYKSVGKGKGGWPEDNLYRSREASI